MDRPNSVRVSVDIWRDKERLRELLGLLAKSGKSIGAVNFFTAPTHSPLPIAEIKKIADVLADRMELVRSFGFAAGINHLATIGHHEEDIPSSLHGYTPMTNCRGEESRGTFCMNDGAFLREYVAESYKLLAAARPDLIWIDDDVRFRHGPIGAGCFCEHCIELFNERHGFSFTREELVAALDRDADLRVKWLRFNTATLCALMKTVGEAVRSVDEKITLGFMTGERWLEGFDFAAIARALSDGGKYEIMWRPGGGAYEDVRFDEIVEKAEQIGRQNAYLPPYVTVKQSEIENFPYEVIRKTPLSTALEAAWDMTAGCTGAAFNIFPSETGEPISVIRDHVKEIDRFSDFYALLSEKLGGASPTGIHTGWTVDAQAYPQDGRPFLSWDGGRLAAYNRELFDFGLPECYDERKAVAFTLTAGSLSARSDDEAEAMLSRGAFMTAGALSEANARGFSELTGFEKGERIYPDARENYVADVLGEGVAGGVRNARQAFYPGDSFSLVPRDGAKTVSRLVDYHDRVLANCCMGLYENARGGRICVSGYYPYSHISDSFKTAQLKSVFLYLSRGTLPSLVASYARVRNHSFVIGKKTFVALLNPTNRTLKALRLIIRTHKDAVTLHGTDGKSVRLAADGQTLCVGESVYRFVTLPRLSPFDMTLIECG